MHLAPHTRFVLGSNHHSRSLGSCRVTAPGIKAGTVAKRVQQLRRLQLCVRSTAEMSNNAGFLGRHPNVYLYVPNLIGAALISICQNLTMSIKRSDNFAASL